MRKYRSFYLESDCMIQNLSISGLKDKTVLNFLGINRVAFDW